MLKFELREQKSESLLDLIEHLQEEATEVEESFENTHKETIDFLAEVMDVLQLCLAILSYYKKGSVELANEKHVEKLRTTHRDKYNLGRIERVAYLLIEEE